jgi:hypothetical protein|tara:strand:+ start:919 stop:1107 length:189 start_codon:yes stop_codon:yes gene_type:complete
MKNKDNVNNDYRMSEEEIRDMNKGGFNKQRRRAARKENKKMLKDYLNGDIDYYDFEDENDTR